MAPQFPTVDLDTATISSVLSSKICMAVLEHVLYLNGQIPFPVNGLMKLNLTSKAHSKASKKRTEILMALDSLSTHLPSTFQSLSWAFATNPALWSSETSRSSTTVHVVLVTGPSLSMAKARCIIELQGFDVKRYGHVASSELTKTLEATTEETRQTDFETTSEADGAWDDLQSQLEKAEDIDGSAKEDLQDQSFQSFITDMSKALLSASSPRKSVVDDTPHARSRSPSAASITFSTTRQTEEESDDDEREEEEDSAEASGASDVEVDARLAEVSVSDDDERLRATVRKISLALASSFDFGRDDFAPTQTHVLIRAPRCFTHPSWLPKQTASKFLDARIQEFFGTNVPPSTRKGALEEGVRVQAAGTRHQPPTSGENVTSDDNDDGRHDLIWWEWCAAPIRGFADL